MCASEIRRDSDNPKNKVKPKFFRSLIILSLFYSHFLITSAEHPSGSLTGLPCLYLLPNTLYSLLLTPYSMLFTSLFCTAFYHSSLLGTKIDDVHSPS